MKTKLSLLFLIFFFAIGEVFSQCSNLYVVLSPDRQHIYFSSNCGTSSKYQIYRANLDGSSLVQLTNATENCFFPAISPNSDKVVYQKGDYGANSEIFIMDKDGKNEVQLTMNGKHDGHPFIAGNGTHIVYESWDANGNFPEIFVMTTSGTGIVQLTNQSGAFWNSAPTMNKTSQKIYFLKGLNADNRIASMNTDGSGELNITQPNTFGYADFAVEFSPQGDKIIFSTTEWRGHNDGCDVVIANPDGSSWDRISMSVAGEYFYHPIFGLDTNDMFYSYARKATDGFQIHRYQRTTSTSTVIMPAWPLPIVEVEDAGPMMYPNPTPDMLTVKMRLDIQDVLLELKDMQGRSVLSEQRSNTNGMLKLNLADYPEGVYLMSISSEGNVIMNRKLVIAR